MPNKINAGIKDVGIKSKICSGFENVDFLNIKTSADFRQKKSKKVPAKLFIVVCFHISAKKLINFHLIILSLRFEKFDDVAVNEQIFL